MVWYTARDGERSGPFDESVLRERAARGELRPSDLVWSTGDAAWREARQVPGLIPVELPPAARRSTSSDNAQREGPGESVPGAQPASAHGAPFEVGPVPSPHVPSSNYFRRHWDGDLTLPVAYWVNGILAMLLVFGLFLAAGMIDWTEFPTGASLAYAAALIATMAVTLWQLVGVWRSADRHTKRGGSSGWAVAAKVAVVLGAIRMTGEISSNYGPQLAELFTIATGDRAYAGHTLRVLHDAAELEVAGPIGFGLTDEVEAILNAHPTVRLVHLTSLGGRVEEAKKLSGLLKARGLDTYVSSECTSACTLAFMGGTHRFIGPTARMGFHAFDFPGLNFEQQAEVRRQGIEFYVAQGTSRAFAERAFDTPITRAWYPTIDELQSAGVVTAVAKDGEFAISGVDMSTLPKLEADLLEIDLFAALKDHEPELYAQYMTTIRDAVQRGRTLDEVRAEIMPEMQNVYSASLPRADDASVILATRLMVDQLSALRSKSGQLCVDAMSTDPAVSVRASAEVPLALRQKELQLGDVIRSASTGRYGPKPGEKFDAQIARLVQELDAQGYNVALLQSIGEARPADPDGLCGVVIGMYTAILRWPSAEAGQVLRTLYDG